MRAKGCREFPINTSGGASERVLACQKAFTCALRGTAALSGPAAFSGPISQGRGLIPASWGSGVSPVPKSEGPGHPHQDRIPLETGATCLGQQIEIDFVVTVFKENGLALVAALRNMMRKPRNHDTSESSHTQTVALNRGIGIMSPYFPQGNRYHVPLFPQGNRYHVPLFPRYHVPLFPISPISLFLSDYLHPSRQSESSHHNSFFGEQQIERTSQDCNRPDDAEK
jgi:hypothetical protein